MKVLLVEDEPVAAARLKDLFRTVAPDFSIEAVTDSVSSTVDWFQTNPMPDLVVMDINLADGSCFSVFDVISISAPIIFCTAYDEYALKAFQSNGIAYLLKPVLESDLRGALDKLDGLRESLAASADNKRGVLRNLNLRDSGYKSRFLIKAGDKLLPVAVTDILCLLAADQGVKMILESGDGYFLDYTMVELEELLDPARFFRVSRQAIVASGGITSVTANMRFTRVSVRGLREELPVARERVKAFRAWLEQ